jgi:hypothetical protein
MRVALRSCALLLVLAMAATTADTDAEDLFNRAREKVLDNARRMPRYTCVETISRTQYQPVPATSSCGPQNARGSLALRDRLRLDVTVADGGEIFSWAGAGKFETYDIGELVGDGASGSGAFGSFLSSVFGSAPDEYRYAGPRNDLERFEYNVPTAKSNYRYRAGPGGPGRIIGYHGTFSVDPADGDVRQLAVESEEFAPADAVCRVQNTMRYKRVKIGDGDFLLPEVATMDAVYRNGAESLNDTRFSDCREYVGESTIRFEEAGTASQPTAAKAAQQPLPPNVRLLIGLSKPINTENAAAGDPVEGVLLRDAIGRQGAIAKTNDRVYGRIFRLQQNMDPPTPRWTLAIRFDTIERNGVKEPIVLKPVGDGAAGVFVFNEHGNMVLDQRFVSEWETR